MINSPQATKRILVIANQQIGDVLLATPLLHALRIAYPQAILDILVYSNTSGILAGNKDCDQVIEVTRHSSARENWQLIKRLLRAYDYAITTQGNDRAYVYAFLAARRRFGLIPDSTRRSAWKRMLCKKWVLLDDKLTHTVEQNAKLADCIGIAKSYQVIPPEDIHASDLLDKLLNLLNLHWRIEEYAVVHPFPMWQYKRWTDAGWHALLDHLLASGKHVVLTGGPADEERSYCENLVLEYQSRQVPNKTGNVGVISIAGKTSFALMSKLLQHAAVYIGPDTVTTHLSAACNTPTLALFGPTNPVKWGPWPFGYASAESPWQNVSPLQRRNNVAILQGLGNCVPCHKAGCNDHNASVSVCMDELPASRVIHALEELLSSVSEHKLLILSNTSSTVGG